MNINDIDKFRAFNERGVNPDYIGEYLMDHLNNAGYSQIDFINKYRDSIYSRLARGYRGDFYSRFERENRGNISQIPKDYRDNISFWDDIFYDVLYEGRSIILKEFHVTEWIPLSPGRYFLPKSFERRKLVQEYGFSYFDEEWGEYFPLGKLEMVLSGVGSIRLSSKILNSKRYFFLGATSSGITHQGIPVAVEEQDYGLLKDKIKDYGGCLCNISGHIEVLPKTVSLVTYSKQIPKYYIVVDKIDYIEPSKRNSLLSSVAIMFQRNDSEKFESIKKWSYCSFNPSYKESLLKAVDWLRDYTMRHEDNPIIMNDFDEYHDYFSNYIEFPLKVLGNGIIDETKINRYKKYYNIEIHTERVVMGDIFENIQNSTIINKSLVENAFNKIRNDIDEATSNALLKVAQHIDESKDPAAGILFNNFTEELNKPQADKSKLKSVWSALEKALPTVNTISEVATKIIPLIS